MNKIYYTGRLTCFSALPVRMNDDIHLRFRFSKNMLSAYGLAIFFISQGAF